MLGDRDRPTGAERRQRRVWQADIESRGWPCAVIISRTPSFTATFARRSIIGRVAGVVPGPPRRPRRHPVPDHHAPFVPSPGPATPAAGPPRPPIIASSRGARAVVHRKSPSSCPQEGHAATPRRCSCRGPTGLGPAPPRWSGPETPGGSGGGAVGPPRRAASVSRARVASAASLIGAPLGSVASALPKPCLRGSSLNGETRWGAKVACANPALGRRYRARATRPSSQTGSGAS